MKVLKMFNKRKLIILSILLIIFIPITCWVISYCQIPEFRKANIIIKATTNESKIDILRMKIRIDNTGTFVSLSYDSDAKAQFGLGGYTCTNYLRNIYIKDTMDYSNDPSEDFLRIDIDKLGILLERNSWENWKESDSIVIPEEIEIHGKKVNLNNTSHEIILEFYPINFERKLYLSTDITNFNKEKFSVIIRTGNEYSIINIPLFARDYTGTYSSFEEEELRTTIEIIKVNWYDRFNVSLFATYLAILFFLISIILSITDRSEVILSVEEKLRMNNDKINDLGKKINNSNDKIVESEKKMDLLYRKITDLNKKQKRMKPQITRKTGK